MKTFLITVQPDFLLVRQLSDFDSLTGRSADSLELDSRDLDSLRWYSGTCPSVEDSLGFLSEGRMEQDNGVSVRDSLFSNCPTLDEGFSSDMMMT